MREEHLDPTANLDLEELVTRLHDLAAFVETDADDSQDIPAQLGRYQILDRIGAGAQAQVYLGYDAVAQRTVVVKWYVGIVAERLVRPIEEARALVAVDHPGIVRFLDIGFSDDAPFIVLQPVTGRSLRQRCDAQPPSFYQAIRWIIDVGRAVQQLHDHGWIHGDLSPNNILIDPDSKPVLIDFGLVQRAQMTSESAGRGSRNFRPPEYEASPGSSRDARSDLYSLAKILRWLVEQCADDGLRHAASPDITRCINRGLEERIEDRPRSVAAWCDSLELAIRRGQRRTRLRKAVVTASLLTVSVLLTGFAGRSALVWWQTFHHQDQQATAWRAFLATKNSGLPSDTSTDIKLRRDFDVSLTWSHGSNTSPGLRQLAPHQNVELRLRAEIPAYVAVYVVSRSPTSSTQVTVQMIYPAREARSETTSQRDTRLFLTTTPSDSSNELLYVVAANHPKPLLGLSETATDVDFMAWREEVTRPHRGLKQRPAISEYIEAFVVR